jgi:Ca-activated chloride channel family protein
MKTFKLLTLLLFYAILLSVVPVYEVVAQTAAPIEIPITYAPESRVYMPGFITDFNAIACPQNGDTPRNPVTGETLSIPICVKDITKGNGDSSGVVTDRIVVAYTGPTSEVDLATLPIIFQPSVNHWLELIRLRTNDPNAVDQTYYPTTHVPVVIAMWERYYNALLSQSTTKLLGWSDLLALLRSGQGWIPYGIQEPQIRFGHTDPIPSSTALSTLISMYQAVASANGRPFGILTPEIVQESIPGVTEIETVVHHYFPRTTELTQYIAQGPDYLHIVALEENSLIEINRERLKNDPNAEILVAMYPAEGTLMHDHPMGIITVNAWWTSSAQQDAAKVFAKFVRLPAQQENIMNLGLMRPEILCQAPDQPDCVTLDTQNIFNAANGVDSDQPTLVLPAPDGAAINAVRESWSQVAKPADIIILVDVSSSMYDEGKLVAAKEAIRQFLPLLKPNTRIGLMAYSDEVYTLVPLSDKSVAEPAILEWVDEEGGTDAQGNWCGPSDEDCDHELIPLNLTSLYQATIDATLAFSNLDTQLPGRIQAVVILSDGENRPPSENTSPTIQEVQTSIGSTNNTSNPVIILPIAFGVDTPLEELNQIASVSRTVVLDATIPKDEPDKREAIRTKLRAAFATISGFLGGQLQ